MNVAERPQAPPDGAGPITVHLFGRTDVGQIREHNEDNFLVADLTRESRSLLEADRRQVIGPRGTVMGVCDGMGGAAAGEVASQIAVDTIYERMAAGDPPGDHDELARRLVASVEEAGIRIFNEARVDRSRRGMGTTSTIAALVDTRLFLAQVGDSRGYLLRKGQLCQVTRDQSLVTQLIEAGQLTEEEAETFEHNNIILQALGTADTVQVDLTYVDLRQGDRLMICSDGLSGMIRNDEIRHVLSGVDDPLAACRELTDRANASGGHDNITVIVADFDGPGVPALGVGDDTLCYRKYALPEAEVLGAQTVRVAPMTTPSVRPPVSNRPSGGGPSVGVTMLGQAVPELASAPASVATIPAPVAVERPYDAGSEPVSIPTTGLPPRLMGMVLVGALVTAAVAGFFLLR